MTLVEYLESKGFSVVAKMGGNWLVSPCPYCGKESTKENKHYLATEEVGHCFACGQKGNLYQVMKHLGDDPRELLGERRTERKEFRGRSGNLVAVWTKERRAKPAKHLSSLPADFVERSSSLLWRPEYAPAEAARAYLMGVRKFPEDALRSAGVGLVPKSRCLSRECGWNGILSGKACPTCGGQVEAAVWWISIPYLTRDGKVTLVKYRSIPPAEKAFSRESGGDTGLYGAWRLSGSLPRLLVVEAELDAVACWALGEPAVAIAGAKNWRDEWLEVFEGMDEIVLAGDADEAGVEAMAKISEKVGAFRCRMLEWPEGVKDAAEFLERGGNPQFFAQLVSEAKPIRGRVWLSGGDFAEIVGRIESRGPDVYGTRTGWKGVDELLGGVRPGEVTVVTAETGSGKSMFSSEWALRMAAAGVPAALASFELGSEAVVSRVLSQVGKRSFYSMLSDRLTLQATIEQAAARPFYFLDLRGSVEMEDLRSILQWGVVRYGVRFVVLDHLHYFMSLRDPRFERQEIDKWLRTLCEWAEEWSTHIVLVVHPAKRGGDFRQPGRIELGDLKGSSGIVQEAHNVLALYRARGYERAKEAAGAPVAEGATELAVLKVRSQVGREGVAWFWFSRESLTYRDQQAQEAQACKELDEQTLRKAAVVGRVKASKSSGKVKTPGTGSGRSTGEDDPGDANEDFEGPFGPTAAEDLILFP